MIDKKYSFSPNRRRLLTRTAMLGTSAAILQIPFARTVLAHTSFEKAPVIGTTEGRIRGLVDDNIYVFRGIRYGAATGGENRFLPPKDPPSWTGIWDAFQFGPMAPQFNPSLPRSTNKFYPIQIPNIPESEDCLRLNIYSKRLESTARQPVMVWLHGGGFSSGAASMSLYHGQGLAGNGVVVVTINHRLNAFGYTYLDELLGDEFATSANVGSLDTVRALTWVRDNIAGFGGDPDNVTIFGESGGGSKVSCLMAMPSAKGLFHRAIIQSGPGLTMGTQENAAKATQALLDAANLKPNRARDLQKLEIKELLAAYFTAARSLGGGPGGGGFSPVIGDKALPHHPFQPGAPAESAKVPLLIGTNRHETSFFTYMAGGVADTDMDEAGLKRGLSAYPNLDADEAIDIYRAANPKATPWQISLMVASDFAFRMNSIVLAERKSAQSGPVYMYRFDRETDMLGGGMGAMHTTEIPYVFNNLDKNRWLIGNSQGDQRLADRMSNAWVAFARTGDPNTSKLPKWPEYTTDKRSTMIFANKNQVVDDPAGKERLVIARAMNYL